MGTEHDWCTCSNGGGHYVARGDPETPHLTNPDPEDGEVVFYCQDDTSNAAKYTSTRTALEEKDKIGVRCCSEDGTEGWSRSSCQSAATYADAEAVCRDEAPDGYRVCTLQEMTSGITENTGCYYNHAYNWVSDACDFESSASSNALVNARQQSDPLAVENESGSNGDPAGNGLAGFSTTSLIGAAIGIVAVLAIAVGIVSVVRRRKRAAMEAETQTAVELGIHKAAVDSAESVTAETVAAVTVHVDEVPSSEVAEATTTADAGNTESV